MAVVEVKAARRSEWSGDENEKGERSYSVPWYVRCDSTSDGPQVVIDAAGLPQLNDSYAVGNDVDATATCQGRSNPSLVDEKANQWVVVINYSTKAADERQDNDGNQTNDPTEWTTKVTKRTATYSKTVNDWQFIPGGPNLPIVPSRMNGERGLVVNSLGQNIVPQPLVDDNRAIFSVTRYYSYIDSATVLTFENTVNLDQFSVKKWYRGFLALDFLVEEGQGWLKSIDFEEFPWKRDGVTTFYWKTTFTLDVNPDGWDERVVDRGNVEKAVQGEPDGWGGVMRAYNRGQGEWVAPMRTMSDPNGNIVMRDVLMDGHGDHHDNFSALPIELLYRRDNRMTIGHLFNV